MFSVSSLPCSVVFLDFLLVLIRLLFYFLLSLLHTFCLLCFLLPTFSASWFSASWFYFLLPTFSASYFPLPTTLGSFPGLLALRLSCWCPPSSTSWFSASWFYFLLPTTLGSFPCLSASWLYFLLPTFSASYFLRFLVILLAFSTFSAFHFLLCLSYWFYCLCLLSL